MMEIVFNVNATEKFDDTENAWIYYKYKYDINDTKMNISNTSSIPVSGECVFNFGNKYQKFIAIINKEKNPEKRKKLKKKLDLCHALHHSLPNIMILPKTGGLNNLKGNIYYSFNWSEWRIKKRPYDCEEWFDRPDSLICYIADYYENKPNFEKMTFMEIGNYFSNSVFTSAIISGENWTEILKILDSFNGVKEFCSKFYQVDDKIIKEWNKSGKLLMKDSIDKYLTRALEFWSVQMKNIFNMLLSHEEMCILIKGKKMLDYVEGELQNFDRSKDLTIKEIDDSFKLKKIEKY